MLTSDTKTAIRDAFRAGQLRVQAVDPDTGTPIVVPVEAVLRHSTPKDMIRTTVEHNGSQSAVETTVDHSLFTRQGDTIKAVRADELRVGDTVAMVTQSVSGGQLTWGTAISLESLPPILFTYDLSVPGPENFVLANGILAHNSYSIGGISLDIERSSKYQSLADNAQSQLEKLSTAKQQTTHYVRGLLQPRYGRGIRSSFGPNLSRGSVGPRSFL